MKRIDIVCDIETLGTGSNPPVFQIAAVAFDISTGNIIDTFNKVCDIATMNTIEGRTLRWWLSTDADLLKKLVLSPTLHPCEFDEELLIKEFIEWIIDIKTSAIESEDKLDHTDIYFWGNGILFDNRIIQTKCNQYNITYPIFYRNDRDVRTLIELAAHKENLTVEQYRETLEKPTEAHNASADAIAEYKSICAAYQRLTT